MGGVPAEGKEDEGEPEGGALDKEPGEGGRKVGAPPGAVVLAVGGLEEVEGDEGGRPNEVEREETVVEER